MSPGAAKEDPAPRVPQVRHVMDVRDAAAYLTISTDTLYRYAKEGIVPSFRLGNRYKFRKAALDEWMDEKAGRKTPPKAGAAKRQRERGRR